MKTMELVRETTIASFPVISDDPDIQAHYLRCRANGCGHKMAEMLAFRQGPCISTDATFLQGRHDFAQFNMKGGRHDDAAHKFYVQKARAAGINPEGKVYLSQLAQYPGDPRAWVADRHDVTAELERQGAGCAGSVKTKTKEVEPIKDTSDGVADDILNEEVINLCLAEPDLAPTPKEKKDLKEKIRSKRRPHWKK